MNLHSLKPAEGSTHRKIRLGRGRASGKGKTCARGQKGQMSRSGSGTKPLFEGGQMPMARRIPKRGFNNYTRKVYCPVNLGLLNKFEDGAEVTVETLREIGLVKGRWDGVKVLAKGEISKKLTVKVTAFSAVAKEQIEAAGGSIEAV